MVTEKKVKLNIYPNTVYLILGSTIEECVQHLTSKHKVKVQSDYDSCWGLTIENGAHNYILVDMSCPDPLSSFVHECVHVSLDVLDRCDVLISHSNSEAACYLTGFIFKSFYKEIEKWV